MLPQFSAKANDRIRMIDRAVMEALAVREAVFGLDDPNLVDLVDALLRGLGQAAARPAAAVKRAKAA